VFGFGKKVRSQVGPVAGFGKVPAMGDFVRSPPASDEMTAFEAWLSRSMEFAELRIGAEWKRTFPQGAPHAFVFSGTVAGKQRGLLAGVMVPSQDAVGRRFPIVVCSPLPLAALSSAPHAAPVLLSAFFRQAEGAARNAALAASQSAFQTAIGTVPPPVVDRADDALRSYDAWALSTPAGSTWSGVYAADGDRWAAHALRTIDEATRPYRGQEAPPQSLGVRLPLGEEPHFGSMWLDVVRRAAGWKTSVPSFFFSLSRSNPKGLILLGAEPPFSVLADLWGPERDSDVVCDLAAGPYARLPKDQVSSERQSLAPAPNTIADLLTTVGT